MTTYTLDTHATIKQLEDAGMDSRQAEAVVAAISRSDAELATKADLAAVKADLKAEISDLRAELKQDLAAVKAEISGLKADLRIIKYFFGPVIILLLLKIAFFS